MNSFDTVKVLLPTTSDDLDRTVKELSEKLAYYLTMSA